MTRIKICGITKIEDAVTAASKGTDYIGMVFADSKRRVSPKTAGEISTVVQNDYPLVQMVGVFVNTSAACINRIVKLCRLDHVQLSGNETWDFCRGIETSVIKVIHVNRDTPACGIEGEIEKGLRLMKGTDFKILLDNFVVDQFGGSGKIFDWNVIKDIVRRYPLIVAGGLNPGNVTELISKFDPWGVDVSSGVEKHGIKDQGLIASFIEVVRKNRREAHHADL